jgi:hypothetical protein
MRKINWPVAFRYLGYLILFAVIILISLLAIKTGGILG